MATSKRKAKSRSDQAGKEIAARDERGPMEVLHFKYRVLGPPTEQEVARVLTPLLDDFIAAVERHCRRTGRGYEVVGIADAIALSEEWCRIAPQFAWAAINLHAGYSAQDESKPYAFYSKIGRGGIPARILAAVDKVNLAVTRTTGKLVRSDEPHEEPVVSSRPEDHRYLVGDVIASEQYEDLLAAKRILEALVRPTGESGAKSSRRPGRPSETDHSVDARVAMEWRSGRWRTKNDLDRELGMDPGFVDHAIERHAARLRRERARSSDKPLSRD